MKKIISFYLKRKKYSAIKKVSAAIFIFLIFSFSSARAQLFTGDTLVSQIPYADNEPVFTQKMTIQSLHNTFTTIYQYAFNVDSSNSRMRPQFDSVLILKYTSDGKLLWFKRFSLSKSGFVFSADTTLNGGYVIAMSYDKVNAVTLLDSLGNITGSQTYADAGHAIFINKIRQLPNGQFAYASTRKSFVKIDTINYFGIFHNPETVYYPLYKFYYEAGMLNSSGTVLWNKIIDSTLTRTKRSNPEYYSGNNKPGSNVELNYNPLTSSINYFYKPLDTTNNAYHLILKQFDLNGLQLSSRIVATDTASNLFFEIGFNPDKRQYSDMDDFLKTGNHYLIRFDSAGTKNLRITDLNGNIQGNIQVTEEVYYPMFLYNMEYTYNAVTSINGDSEFIISNVDVLGQTTLFSKCSFSKIIWQQKFTGNGDTTGFSILSYILNDLFTDNDNHVTGVYLKGYRSLSTGGLAFYLGITKMNTDVNRAVVTAYIDLNNNLIKDSQDSLFRDGSVELTHQSVVNNYPLNYNINDEFGLFLDTGAYTAKIISYAHSLRYYDISPEIKNFSLTIPSQQDTLLFRLTPRPNIQDLQVSIIGLRSSAPGFSAIYKLLIKNTGTKTILQPTLKFFADARQTYFASDSTPSQINNDTLIWNIDSLQMFETREINVTMRNAVVPAMNSGDTLTLYAAALPIENDSFVPDNQFILKQVVVNALDPNDKSEAHGSGITSQQLQSGEYLYYTIRFQNTGTNYASKIKVVDTLSDKLDWTTIEIISNSHQLNFKVERQRYLTWWNDDTYLPDSTSDEINSHGYIAFRVRPKTNLQSTDIIENRAHIYFDYNPAIATNTATTKLLEERITNISSQKINGIKLYPSPTENSVTLNFDALINQSLDIKVYDVNGKEMHKENLKTTEGLNSVQINLSGYSNGIYFIRLNEDGKNLYYGKVLKQ